MLHRTTSPHVLYISSMNGNRNGVAKLAERERRSKWTHWDLNPGPSACEADVIPLHHVPLKENAIG